MSKKRVMLEIAPTGYSNYTETEIVRGFVCPLCRAVGWYVWQEIVQQNDRAVSCERCSGTGKLRAKVTVVWEADT